MGPGLVVVPEITSFPGLDKVGPGEGVEDILWWGLPLVGVSGGALSQIGGGCFAGVGREAPGQNPSFGGIGILAGYFYVVVGDPGVDKVAFELFACGAWLDDRCRQVLGVSHHKLYYTVLVAPECI